MISYFPLIAITGILGLFSFGKNKLLVSLADEMGLGYSGKLFSKKSKISGNYRGYNLLIDTIKKVERWNDIDYFRVFIGLKNPTNFNLNLYEEDVFSKVGKSGAQQDAKVNNLQFDKNFMIKCNDEECLRTILCEDIQKKILTLQSFNARIENNKAYMEHSGRLTHPDQLRSRIDILIDILDGVDSLK